MHYIFFLLIFTTKVWSKATESGYLLGELEDLFEEFIQKHEKHYESNEEKQMRFEIFKKNLQEISEKNANEEDSATYDLAEVNHFSDMTDEEFNPYLSGLKVSDLSRSSCNYPADVLNLSLSTAPKQFDWRSKGVVSKVIDQKRCGSCWAFSSTGHLEGQYAIKHKKMVLFSEQQLVDCDKVSNNCHGGVMTDAFEYTMKHGLMTEHAYPYKARVSRCHEKKGHAAVKVLSCNTHPLHNEDILKNLLYSKGPISIALCSTSWKHYKRGVLSNCCSGLTHAVLLVGYGTENKTPYWLIKNSWGANWGDKGYIKIQRGKNTCNLMNDFITTANIA